MVFFFATSLTYGFASAQRCEEIVPTAEVVNGNINLRSTTPRFTIQTLFRFRLTQGDILGTVNRGTRVKVLGRRIVVGTYEWFMVEYCDNKQYHKGWVYAGKVGQRQYIRLDEGVESLIPEISSNFRPSNVFIRYLARSFLVSEVVAADGVVSEPDIKTNAWLTLLMGLCYVLIFVLSLYFVRKFVFGDTKGANLYSFLISIAILLILGFISSTEYANIIGNWLGKQ
jgi:hypothetical protein